MMLHFIRCDGRGLDMPLVQLGAGGGEQEEDTKRHKVTVQNIFQGDIKAFFHGVLP